MKRLLGVIAIIVLGWFGFQIVSGSGAVAECTQQGIAYFKEIKAYPRLPNGRLAEDVVRARCRMTTGAFSL